MSITAQDLANTNNTDRSDNRSDFPANNKAHQDFLSYCHQAGLATIYQAKNWLNPAPISVLKEKYINGPAAEKSAARSEMFIQVGDFRNLDGAILSWLLEGKKRGFNGTAMTFEMIAECIEVCTGRKCSERSVSRYLNEFEARGLIRFHWMPTGGTTINSRGQFVAKRIRQVWVTGYAKLLISFTPEYIDLPTPNRLLTVQKPRDTEPLSGAHVSLEAIRNDNTNSETVEVCTTCHRGHKEGSTCPGPEDTPAADPSQIVSHVRTNSAANGKGQACEHRALDGQAEPGRAAEKKRIRKRHASTWQALRLQFLAELERNLDKSPGAQVVLRIARTQTDRQFPAIIPTVLDWNKIIWTWADRSWHVRRKSLRKNIIPALAAAAVALVPPDSSRIHNTSLPKKEREKAARAFAAYKNAAAWQKTISKTILNGQYPQAAKDWAQEHAFELDTYSSHINAGRMAPGDLDDKTRLTFQVLADIIGAG
jgi:hypothetical protein